MKKVIIGLTLILLGLPVYSQDYILVNAESLRKILRFNIGYTYFSIEQADSGSGSAQGLHLANEVKIASAFFDADKEFTVHDAFYFDINFGRLNGTKHTIGDESESRFSMVTNMGYLLLAGYRENKWAALAGIDFRWRRARVGGVEMPYLDGPLFYDSRPIVLRGEYRLSKENPNKRAILMLWSTLNNSISSKRTPYQSARLELPLSSKGKWWVMLQYTLQTALAQDVFRLGTPQEGVFNQFAAGIRYSGLP